MATGTLQKSLINEVNKRPLYKGFDVTSGQTVTIQPVYNGIMSLTRAGNGLYGLYWGGGVTKHVDATAFVVSLENRVLTVKNNSGMTAECFLVYSES